TNNVSMETLMRAGLAPDAVVKENDRDGDGDPEDVHIKLEVVELNGSSPDTPDIIPRVPPPPLIRSISFHASRSPPASHRGSGSSRRRGSGWLRGASRICAPTPSIACR